MWAIGVATALLVVLPARAGGADQLRQFLTQHKDGAMKAAPRINQLAREILAQNRSAKAK